MPTGDAILDDIIDALVDGPKTHNQIVISLRGKRALTGTEVNSYLYTYRDRFFSPDREPQDGLPTWTLSERVRQNRLKGRGVS